MKKSFILFTLFALLVGCTSIKEYPPIQLDEKTKLIPIVAKVKDFVGGNSLLVYERYMVRENEKPELVKSDSNAKTSNLKDALDSIPMPFSLP